MECRLSRLKKGFERFLKERIHWKSPRLRRSLSKEGVKRDDMRRLCDVHMAIFREQIENQNLNLKPSQPISILMEEHKIMTKWLKISLSLANKILKVTDIRYVSEDIHQVEHLASDFADSEKHYLREENVLFPMLEKHGITEPPAVMWMEHDEIRDQKKKFQALMQDVNQANFRSLQRSALGNQRKRLGNLLPSHFYKENNILFPSGTKRYNTAGMG